jgi:hypothetical protein
MLINNAGPLCASAASCGQDPRPAGGSVSVSVSVVYCEVVCGGGKDRNRFISVNMGSIDRSLFGMAKILLGSSLLRRWICQR